MTWLAFAVSLAAAFSPGADDQPTPAGWTRQRIAVGACTIAVPPRVQGEVVQGIDSFVAEYRSPEFRIGLDFGMYGGAPDCRIHACAATEIDGVPATLAHGEQTPSANEPLLLRWLHLYVHLPDPAGSNALSLVAYVNCTPAGCDAAERILRSIDFNLEPRRRTE